MDYAMNEQLLVSDIMSYAPLSDEESMERVFYSCKDKPLDLKFSREHDLYKLIIKNGCSCRFHALVRAATPLKEDEEGPDEADEDLSNRHFKMIPEEYLIDVIENADGIEILRFSEKHKPERAFLGFNERTDALVFVSVDSDTLKYFFTFFLKSYKEISEKNVKKYLEVFEGEFESMVIKKNYFFKIYG